MKNKKYLLIFEYGRKCQSKAEEYMYAACEKLDRRVIDAEDIEAFKQEIEQLPQQAAEAFPRCKAQCVEVLDQTFNGELYDDWSIHIGSNECCRLRLKAFYQ